MASWTSITAAAFSVALVSCARPIPWWEDSTRPRCCLDLASCSAVLRSPTQSATSGAVPHCVDDAEKLVANHGAEALPVVHDLLGSGSPDQRQLGARLAWDVERMGLQRGESGRASEEEEALAPVLAQAWLAHREDFLFRPIEFNRSPQLLPVWLDVLDRPFAGAARIATERLVELGPGAAGSIDRLADMATTHWDSAVRLAAARAYNRLAGGAKRIGPTLDRCPASVVRRDPPDASWVVRLAQGDVQLRDATAAASVPMVHETTLEFEAHGHALVVGRDLLFAYSVLEAGGVIEVWRDGGAISLGRVGDPILLEPRGDEVLVLGGCRGWCLDVLAHGPDGAWRHRALANGSGSPVAFGIETLGAVDLLVVDDRSWPGQASVPCEAPQSTRGPFRLDRGGPFVLLRIDRDGSVTVRD